MNINYSIKVYKQYFNFACSHFLIFENGTREPLHGHNYKVMVKGRASELKGDLVFDFLDIKPIVRDICNSLDHKLLIPKFNNKLQLFTQNANTVINTPDGSMFSIPTQDILMLPIHNTSAELLAQYLCNEIVRTTFEKYHFRFKEIEVEVEETPGQSAVYYHKEEL